MTQPLRLPPNSYFDDPADKIDRADQAESYDMLVRSLASEGLLRMVEWITRGRGGVTNRALRADIVVLTIRKKFFPCERPSAAWVAREHHISRQRASELWRDFSKYIAPYLQFRGQRFLNQRRGRGGRATSKAV